MTNHTISTTVSILEKIFDYVNREFYDSSLERPIITVSPNSRTNAYGWFTLGKVWKAEEDKEFFEINICAEYLNRPIFDVVGTMMHEMVHLYCNVNGIKDTSRGTTYHNKNFKIEAEKRGLSIEKDSKAGWTKTTLNQDGKIFVAKCKFEPFNLHRQADMLKSGTTGTRSKSSSRKYVCPNCEMSVRATKEVRIMCMDCNTEMECE